MSIRLTAARIGLAFALANVATSAIAQGPAPQDQPGAASAQTQPVDPSPSASPDAAPALPQAPDDSSGGAATSAGPVVQSGPPQEGATAPAGGSDETPPAVAPAPADIPDAPGETPPSDAPAPQAPFATEFPGAEDVAGSAEAEVSAMPHDLSPWGMFMAADWVVQAVMVGLVFASFVTWTIWLAKAVELGIAKSRARAQVRRLEEAASLRAAIDGGRRPLKSGPVAALALTAAAESDLSGQLPAEGVKERVAVALQRIEARSGRRMSRGTGMLATIGSTAPFVGLFGTVWGIMNSFIGIAETNTTNLAIVAPGIAEALLATGIGLVAAIPAVIIYNVFARSIAGYRAILADGSAAVLRHLSRDLDRRDAGYRHASDAYAQPAE